MTTRFGGAVRVAIGWVLELERGGCLTESSELVTPIWRHFRGNFFSEQSASRIQYGEWETRSKNQRYRSQRRLLRREVRLHYRGQLVAIVEMMGIEDLVQYRHQDNKSYTGWGVKRIQYATRFEKKPTDWIDVTLENLSMRSAEVDGEPW